MSKISNPIDNSKLLTDTALEQRVKDMLQPMINKFEKDHKGKEITESDIEGLYTQLSDNLSKDPRIGPKILVDTNKVLKEMASNIAEEIQEGHKISTSDKLIRGFSDFCNNIGLKKIGTACLKLIREDTNLINQLDKIANEVKSTKTISQVGDSPSTKISKPITKPKIKGSMEH